MNVSDSSGNLTHSAHLLQIIYDQLNSYRTNGHIESMQHKNDQQYQLNHNLSQPSSAYMYLYSAVHNLVQQLTSSTQNVLHNVVAKLPSTSVNYFQQQTAIPLQSGPISEPTNNSINIFANSSSLFNTAGFIETIPMPTDEASLNTELGLGPIRDPLWTAVPMTILYILILVTGVIGNLVTCAVIVRNRYMHTATNYYLFSLAISDLLLLILGLPVEIQQIWQRYPYAFGEIFCVLRGFSSEASTNSSVLTITAFTVERYVAICHPLRAHTMSKLSRAVKLIIIIWLLGTLCAAPIAYQFGIVYDYVHDDLLIPQSAMCNIKRFIPYLKVHIFALQSLLVFVIPVTLISVLYILIGLKLRQSSQSARGDMSKIRRRPVKRLHSETNSSGTSGSIQSKHNQPTQAKYYSSSIESIEINNNPNRSSPPSSLLKSGRNPKLKELPTMSSTHSITFAPTMSTGKSNNNTIVPSSSQHYIDHRYRSRLTKFTASNSSSNSSSGNSLSQRRAVIKMLSKTIQFFFSI
ncbi:hypothetical protein RDWZM_003730 [Blomia tropicalis]|uniref:G-protein coupled receptors family 1 profile domain-containing protein n=1 Tax=Blomia tropicalis TaxID=40697 RepID=A0A9Q0MJZ6_BLOTA|nr:hypothetical protein RDWZM_003730 [Blomia tropicalis]